MNTKKNGLQKMSHTVLTIQVPWRQLSDKNGMPPLYPEDLEEIFKASSLTHAHPRSKIACAIYCLIAGYLFMMKGCDLASQVSKGLSFALGCCERLHVSNSELSHYQRLEELVEDHVKGMKKLSRDDVKSNGYVVSTLEAAIWCLLKNNYYEDTVLAAVNLGGDTDTIAAICGGLAGIYYGDDPKKGIPKRWINRICNKEEVIRISRNFDEVLWINTRLLGDDFTKCKIDRDVLLALKTHRVMSKLEVEDSVVAMELKVDLCFSEKEYRMMTIGIGDYEPGYDSQGLCVAGNKLYFFDFIYGDRKIHFFAPIVKEEDKYRIRKICLGYVAKDNAEEINFCCRIIYGFFLKKDVSYVQNYLDRHMYNESVVVKVWREFGA